MSNLKLIILALVVFGLIIAFGRNPGDEVRKKRAERAGRNLVTKIVEANKKKGNGMMGMGSNLLNGGGGALPNHQPSTNPMADQLQQNENQGQTVNGGINPFQPNTAHPNNRTLHRDGPGSGQQAPADDYYPPEPRNKQIRIPLSDNGMPEGLTPAAAELLKKKYWLTLAA